MKLIIIIVLCLFLVSFAAAQAPIAPELPQVTHNDIQLMVGRYAFVYDVSEVKMMKMLRCESNFDIDAINTEEVHGSSYGIAQFRQSTFDEWSKKAGIESGSPYNPDDAIKTMAYMISKGKGKHWTCYRKLVK